MKLHDRDWYANAADHQMAQELSRLDRSEEDEHYRILNESLSLHRPLHHASVATDELARLEDGAAALVREREWDRLND